MPSKHAVEGSSPFGSAIFFIAKIIISINMKKNFYVELLNKLEQLKDEGKYAEAISLIDDEFSMPYIPSDVYKKLKDYYLFFKSKVAVDPSDKHKKVFDAFDLLITSLGMSDLESVEKDFIIDALYHSKQLNACLFKKELLGFLQRPHSLVSYFAKIKIINLLKKQECVKELDYLNNFGVIQHINLDEVKTFQESKYFAIESNKLESNKSTEELVNNFAFITLENVFATTFPKYDDPIFANVGTYCVFYALRHFKDKKGYDALKARLGLKDTEIKYNMNKIDKIMKVVLKYS